MSEAMQKSFTAVFDCEARAVGKMRSEMTVHWREPRQMSWEMASDETGFQGGDGTAPVPMAYFMAGLTSCLMTQVRAFAKKMRIDVRDAVVNCHAEWEATVEGRDPYVAAPKGVRMDIEFDSDASVEDRLRLTEAAKKGCFIEAIVREPTFVAHRLKTEDGWIDA